MVFFVFIILYFGVSWILDNAIVLINIPPRYNWNIIESGIKHHNTLTNIDIYTVYMIGWSTPT